MNRTVREHYPVAELPEGLRKGFGPDARVRVTVEHHASGVPRLKPVMSLKETCTLVQAYPSTRTMGDIVADVRRQRDEWSD